MQSLSMSEDHSVQDAEQDALSHPDVVDLVRDRLEELRKRLLDSSRRNPLININFRPNSLSVMRVVDELPDILRHNLTNGTAMRLVPLPALEEELPDEQTDAFQDALFLARKEDEEYLAAIDEHHYTSSAAVRRYSLNLHDRKRRVDTVAASHTQSISKVRAGVDGYQ